MSSEATRYVRDVVDVPSNLAGILFTVASYTDEQGRGCYASAQKLGKGAKKKQRQAEKDLAILRKMGAIEPGDQSLVAHIHPDHRPIVYDLPGAAEWIAANPVEEKRPTVLRNGGTHRPPRRGTTVVPGSNPPSSTTDKTSPYGGGDRAGRARGSAPRTGDVALCPSFLDDGEGRCTECGFPEPNQRHRRKA